MSALLAGEEAVAIAMSTGSVSRTRNCLALVDLERRRRSRRAASGAASAGEQPTPSDRDQQGDQDSASVPRIARSALAGDPADLLDRRQPLVELGAGSPTMTSVSRSSSLAIWLTSADSSAEIEPLAAATAKHARRTSMRCCSVARFGELAGDDVVLGPADGLRLQLGHLGDEDRRSARRARRGPGAPAR